MTEAGLVSNPLAVAGAAALAKFERAFEERTRDAGAVEDPSDANWDGSPRARRKARSQRARGPSRPGNSTLPGLLQHTSPDLLTLATQGCPSNKLPAGATGGHHVP